MPLPVLANTNLPVRFAIVHNGSCSSYAEEMTFGVDITRFQASGERAEIISAVEQPHPQQDGTDADWLAAALSPKLSAPEAQRDALQVALANGWAPWYDMSFTKLVRLPEGSTLTLALCEAPPFSSLSSSASLASSSPVEEEAAASMATCETEMRTDWGPKGARAVLRPGMHALDRSYAQLYAATPTCNISIEFSGGHEQLLSAVRVVSGCEHAELVVIGGAAWQRMHDVRVTSPSSLTLTPYGDGVRTSVVHTTRPSVPPAPGANESSLILPSEVAAQPHLAIPLWLLRSDRDAAVGLSSDAPLTLGEIESRLATARQAEERRCAAFGAEHAEVKLATQAAVMWNTVYNPLEGVIAPVIRGNPWGWDPATTSDDWAYVLFDWDTHFAAYMLSLDRAARQLSYSVLISVIKAKSAEGFIPNGWAPTRKSTHSQPPVGAKVLREMYGKFGDVWLVELLFDDLLDWSNWFDAHRRLAPLNLTALGGDDMQAARYESGLDNSPMYDGEFFQPAQPNGYGLMAMYDVGMASMAAMSDEALAELADVLNRHHVAATLRGRAAAMRQRIATHLWDAQSGTYVNKWANGTFNRRVSPTSFYPLMAGAATAERCEAMVHGWLLNASRFCVTPHGDFAGNDPAGCYWGLPSISADDPAFPALGYWRGFVWGPMALLTYWSLSHDTCGSLPLVAQARKALTQQMRQVFLKQWRLHHHVCENFSPHRDANECTGMHYYHWGGLAGLISLLEAGFYHRA